MNILSSQTEVLLFCSVIVFSLFVFLALLDYIMKHDFSF